VSSKEVAKDSLGMDLYSPVIGTIGRLHPEKGLEYLIKAMHKVVKEIPKVKLLVAGDTTLGDKEYYRAIKDLAKGLDLQNAIVFLGYQKDVSKIMTTFDIFALPSLREPFGLVTLEAMAMAKPVIATNTGGTPEIVIDGQTGILVPPRNVSALADAIIRLLRDKQLAMRMGLAGRARVHDCFSVEKMMNKIEDVYEGVLAGRQT
jgi:glycosyltransferase involved in cell wall biosynthesis